MHDRQKTSCDIRAFRGGIEKSGKRDAELIMIPNYGMLRFGTELSELGAKYVNKILGSLFICGEMYPLQS